MKRSILVGVMVLGTSFCSQSFGFDLLDRMLGLKGSGCSSSCCETVVCDSPCGGCAEPACGAESCCDPCAEPACGAESCCDPCGEPACGAESCCDPCGQPACGAEACCDPCAPRTRLLDKLFGGLKCNKGCDSCCETACEPACGAEVCCDPCGAPTCGAEVSCCPPKKGGLLKKLFGKLKKNNCCDSGCDVACDTGCSSCSSCGSAPAAAPTPAPEAAPAVDQSMPPAPVVDHSAFLNSKRRVIQASSYAR